MIEFEYWQLLFFPLFFVLGWAAARIDIRHLVKESRALPRSYFQGLNFLLNEQPDRAIESFVDAVKVDPQTVELHFALGSLFRRRGETERAIRMHQNLVERDDLPQDLKLQALAELGQDYLKAGLLDRAEEVFDKLHDSSMVNEAKRNLLEIYQLEKDWGKAISIAQSPRTQNRRRSPRVLANSRRRRIGDAPHQLDIWLASAAGGPSGAGGSNRPGSGAVRTFAGQRESRA